MPWGLTRFHHTGQSHFVTFCWPTQARPSSVKIWLEMVRIALATLRCYSQSMSEPELTTTMIYRSGTNPVLGAGWDVMQVLCHRSDGERNSFMIARDADGTIIRKTDIMLDRWEVVNDEKDLRDFRHCFDERDRLAAEAAANMEKAKDPCKCGHPFDSHTRDIHDTGAMKVDEALLPPKRYDILSDKPAGEAGCTECPCSRWTPASY